MKKQNILYTLKILENESDKNNPLTQTEIANIISEVYPCDRKTVGRNIRCLINMGYPIVKVNQGFYMGKRLFTIEERDIVFDAIRESSKISGQKKDEIIQSLMPILNKIKR